MTGNEQIRAHVRELLRWYAAMGVKDVSGHDAVDWLARDGAVPGAEVLEGLVPRDVRQPAFPSTQDQIRSPPPRSHQPNAGFAAAQPDAAIMSAREQAAAATSLDVLRETLSTFEGCGLKATAKNLCFFRGSETADVMIVGEAPGRDEDLVGRPFVGRAGQLLDKMLDAVGLDEQQVHITNIVYWRPPGNRTPSPQEVQVCRPFLERQVALVKPRVLLLLGGAAAKSVYDTTDGIMRLRGKWCDAPLGGGAMKSIASLHPAFLLRSPVHKRLAWRDLLALKAGLPIAS